MNDAVNHPAHYQGANGIEAADVIDDFGLGYWLGCVVKYVLRAGRKGDAIEDLKKARWCLEREIQKREEAMRDAAETGAQSPVKQAIDRLKNRPVAIPPSRYAPGGMKW